MLEIKLTINGEEKVFTGDVDNLKSKDWNDVICDEVESAESYERGHEMFSV